jgi:hypothetical protein
MFHMRATCSVDLILLNFITLITYGEEYALLNSLLCNFFFRPARDATERYANRSCTVLIYIDHKCMQNNLATIIQQYLAHTRVYLTVSGLAAWSENCKWYSSLPLCAVVSLFCESV